MATDNQYDFFKNIQLDDDGNVKVVLVTKVDPTEKGISQYKTFGDIELTPEGYLKIYVD